MIRFKPLQHYSAGALPYTIAMDESCTTGLALSTPVILAYLNEDLDTTVKACQTQLRFTHANPQMVTNVRGVPCSVACVSPSHPPSLQIRIYAKLLRDLMQCTTREAKLARIAACSIEYSHGSIDIAAIAHNGRSDEDNFWGPDAAFSVR